MRSTLIIGAFIALATGIAIGVQSTISSRVGSLIGGIRTGLLTNLVGGVVAGAIVLILVVIQGRNSWQLSSPAVIMLVISGSLGILIITGVSFSLQRTGVAAGLATIILGQLLISGIVDARGIGGVEPIPFTFQRVLGFAVMILAVYLLMPKE
jgi:transporter family-2 protein